jgi:hypothetical protein
MVGLLILFTAAGALTSIWIGGALTYINRYVGWDALFALMPNDLALFAFGVFGPVALLWLVLGLVQMTLSSNRQESVLRQMVVQERRASDQIEAQVRTLIQMQDESRRRSVIDGMDLVLKDLNGQAAVLAERLGMISPDETDTLWGRTVSGDVWAFSYAFLTRAAIYSDFPDLLAERLAQDDISSSALQLFLRRYDMLLESFRETNADKLARAVLEDGPLARLHSLFATVNLRAVRLRQGFDTGTESDLAADVAVHGAYAGADYMPAGAGDAGSDPYAPSSYDVPAYLASAYHAQHPAAPVEEEDANAFPLGHPPADLGQPAPQAEAGYGQGHASAYGEAESFGYREGLRTTPLPPVDPLRPGPPCPADPQADLRPDFSGYEDEHSEPAPEDHEGALRDGASEPDAAEQAEAARIETEQAELARLAIERAERERFDAEQAEVARIEAEQAEAARIEAERAERAEQARQEAEQAEQARIEAEQAEAARIEAEQAEIARREAERAELARIEAEQAEAARIEAERAERAEQARREAEQAEQARIEAEQAEAARIEAEQAEIARREAERAELARIEAEQAETARIEAEQAEQARREAEQAEQARIEAEQAEAARIEAEQAEIARLKAERAELARIEAERAEAARIESERAEQARREAEQAERERIEAEKAEAARIEAEQAELARLEAERAEFERIEAEKAEAARLEAERAEQARLDAEQAERERIEAEQARLEAERAERERIEAEKAEVVRLEAEREALSRLATEREQEEQSGQARIAAERAAIAAQMEAAESMASRAETTLDEDDDEDPLLLEQEDEESYDFGGLDLSAMESSIAQSLSEMPTPAPEEPTSAEPEVASEEPTSPDQVPDDDEASMDFSMARLQELLRQMEDPTPPPSTES